MSDDLRGPIPDVWGPGHVVRSLAMVCAVVKARFGHSLEVAISTSQWNFLVCVPSSENLVPPSVATEPRTVKV